MTRALSDYERKARTEPCERCGSVVGQPCLSVNGNVLRAHLTRRTATGLPQNYRLSLYRIPVARPPRRRNPLFTARPSER